MKAEETIERYETENGLVVNSFQKCVFDIPETIENNY